MNNKPEVTDVKTQDDKTVKSSRGKSRKSRGKPRKFGSSRVAVNSPEFWNKVPGLLGAAGRIPSTNPMGVTYAGYGPKMEALSFKNQLLSIGWIPSIGPASGLVSDPVNTSSQQLYTYIRQSISGSRSYDAADLSQYIFAIYNLHAYFHFLKLIYGATNIVTPLNRDIARAIVGACGCDYADIINHKADLLFYINNFAYKLTQFAIPGGMSMLEHWKLLLSGIFSDRYVNTLKNQFYIFTPRHFYRYDWQNAKLILDATKTFVASSQTITFSDLTTYGNKLINALVGNQDVGTMSGDILRAFEGHLEPATPINADYALTINLTSNEMLNQIRNMTFFEMMDADQFDIGQQGAFTLNYPNADHNHPLVRLAKGDTDLSTDDSRINELTVSYSKGYPLIGFEEHMTEDAIMVATRMMATYDVESQGGVDDVTAYLTSWGVEVFFSPVFVNVNDGTFNITTWHTQYSWDQTADPRIEAMRTEFEGAPRFTTFQYLLNDSQAILSNGVDHYALDNFLLLPYDLLKDLNYTAAQSAFYVPLAASAVAK